MLDGGHEDIHSTGFDCFSRNVGDLNFVFALAASLRPCVLFRQCLNVCLLRPNIRPINSVGAPSVVVLRRLPGGLLKM